MRRRAAKALRALLAAAWMGAGAMACAQGPFFEHADTTFLLRDFRTGYHAVFVAAPGEALWHGRAAADPGDMLRNRHVQAQMRMLDELGVRPVPSARLPRMDRVGVGRLHGQWYLYAPSDWSGHRQLQARDGWLVTNEAEGAALHAIAGLGPQAEGEAVDLRCVSLVSHAMDPGRDTVAVRAWTVDPQAGVELWEYRDAYGDARYELMVPLERAAALPVLVNFAPSRKAREVAFEEPGPHLIPR